VGEKLTPINLSSISFFLIKKKQKIKTSLVLASFPWFFLNRKKLSRLQRDQTTFCFWRKNRQKAERRTKARSIGPAYTQVVISGHHSVYLSIALGAASTSPFQWRKNSENAWGIVGWERPEPHYLSLSKRLRQ